MAIPVIGPGLAMAVPVKNASEILTGEIGTFGLLRSASLLRTIQIVIMPNYPNSEEVSQYNLRIFHKHYAFCFILSF